MPLSFRDCCVPEKEDVKNYIKLKKKVHKQEWIAERAPQGKKRESTLPYASSFHHFLCWTHFYNTSRSISYHIFNRVKKPSRKIYFLFERKIARIRIWGSWAEIKREGALALSWGRWRGFKVFLRIVYVRRCTYTALYPTGWAHICACPGAMSIRFQVLI